MSGPGRIPAQEHRPFSTRRFWFAEQVGGSGTNSILAAPGVSPDSATYRRFDLRQVT